ncbi:hypothetical protein J4Q44_G00333430 [Coregonus suidteri]|uniref:Uncharacterized protein n=1 Tax=Coregonus suidteri TaxID=861788 RepID=A0AAN8L183_9TELE
MCNPELGLTTISQCRQCDGDRYCPLRNGTSATGQCLYYCSCGNTSPQPPSHSAGTSSQYQYPCPAGTTNPHTRMGSPQDCLPCPPGLICASRGLSFPSHLYQAGSYSPYRHNSSLPGSITCLAGHMCPLGSAIQVPCVPGTYQDQPGQAECFTCPQGFTLQVQYILTREHTRRPLVQRDTTAPQAHGLVWSTHAQLARLVGRPARLISVPCPPGKYCSSAGLAVPTGQCSPRYLCIQGSVTSQPAGETTGGKCTAGSYCPLGTSHMLLCPPGTFSSFEGAVSVAVCQPCVPGQYCANFGHAYPSGPCSAGFYCLIGSRTPTPNHNATSTFLGEYGGQSEAYCEACPSGFYCPVWGQTTTELRCPQGFYYPVGSAYPQPCDTGSYCGQTGLEAPSGLCTPGYVCSRGSKAPHASLCPPGHYCPQGTPLPLPCPPGTLKGFYCPVGSAYPQPCDTGSYCGQTGLEAPSGLCTPGYVCSRGSKAPHASLCPPGHYCPQGTPLPLPCPPGTLKGRSGGSTVDDCQPYCDQTGSAEPSAGTGYPLLCPSGSLSSSPGLRGVEECQRCPPWHFCDRPELVLTLDAAPCSAGYVCLGGSSSAHPSDGLHGYLCPTGHRCPVGTASEVPCEPGIYSPAPGAAHCLICPNGTMCPSSATQEPSLCPAGHFCPAGPISASVERQVQIPRAQPSFPGTGPAPWATIACLGPSPHCRVLQAASETTPGGYP